MLIEKGFEVFMANTDGITTMVPVERKEEYYQICKEWEKLSMLQLEYSDYSKMVMMSVNDYIAVYTNGKVKYKGDFLYDRELHKDPSFKIVPIALSEYFVKGIPIENVICNFPYEYDTFDGKGTKRNTTIYNYLGRVKTNKGSKLVKRYVKEGKFVEDEFSKTTRYYVSTNGDKFIKILPDSTEDNIILQKQMNQTSIFDFIDDVLSNEELTKETEIHVGRFCTEMNKFIEKPFQEYNFDLNFYLNECLKIKQKVENE